VKGITDENEKERKESMLEKKTIARYSDMLPPRSCHVLLN